MDAIITNIQKALQNKLPGEKAHLPMALFSRNEHARILQASRNYRESAVALILFSQKEKIRIILMQRAAYKGFHSGEVCFPGGKKDENESQLLHTVKREVKEEIGLNSTQLELLGKLTPVYIPVSQFKVQPFVFYHKNPPKLKLDLREVAEVFTFPIQDLWKKEIVQKKTIQINGDRTLKDVPYFDIQNRVVWGATALIINEFKELLS